MGVVGLSDTKALPVRDFEGSAGGRTEAPTEIGGGFRVWLVVFALLVVHGLVDFSTMLRCAYTNDHEGKAESVGPHPLDLYNECLDANEDQADPCSECQSDGLACCRFTGC